MEPNLCYDLLIDGFSRADGYDDDRDRVPLDLINNPKTLGAERMESIKIIL